MTTAATEPTRGEKYGWIFAAVWLFYLLDTVSALLTRASMPWRVPFCEETALPSGVRGPVERSALARLAASLRSEMVFTL